MTLIRITLPLVKGPLLVGTMLALGRSLGEVGITLMLGGNITGRTNTLSLEIYNAVFNSDYQRAMLLCAVLAVISLTLFTGVRRFGGATLQLSRSCPALSSRRQCVRSIIQMPTPWEGQA